MLNFGTFLLMQSPSARPSGEMYTRAIDIAQSQPICAASYFRDDAVLPEHQARHPQCARATDDGYRNCVPSHYRGHRESAIDWKVNDIGARMRRQLFPLSQHHQVEWIQAVLGGDCGPGQ